MHLWRLSGAEHARRFDGGYGLGHDGRWNSRGRPITYCATGPALCVLEKLVHIEDVTLIPDGAMLVRYDVPDDVAIEGLVFDAFPADWRMNETWTRAIGDDWLRTVSSCLLRVPSVVVPIADCDDRNVLINHDHEDARSIAIAAIEPFDYDPRLFDYG